MHDQLTLEAGNRGEASPKGSWLFAAFVFCATTTVVLIAILLRRGGSSAELGRQETGRQETGREGGEGPGGERSAGPDAAVPEFEVLDAGMRAGDGATELSDEGAAAGHSAGLPLEPGKPRLRGARRRDSETAGFQGPREVAPSRGYLPSEQLLIDLYREASASVVRITSQTVIQQAPNLWRRINAESGSGFVWDENGYIVTNLHLVGGSFEPAGAVVTLWNGTTYEADFVEKFEQYDLAVLYIRAPKEILRPIALGLSSGLQVGQRVLAIGNPFGLDQTLATGIISGLERQAMSPSGKAMAGLIQIDATINPGNSGGPLLDSSGRLIGINTFIPAASRTSSGVGFAVPVDLINMIVPEIIAHGRIPWPVLGAYLASDSETKLYNLEREGVLVIEVAQGCSAESAGLRTLRPLGRTGLAAFDLLVGIDGHPIRCREDLDAVMLKRRAGDTIALDVWREDGHETRIFVLLGAVESQQMTTSR